MATSKSTEGDAMLLSADGAKVAREPPMIEFATVFAPGRGIGVLHLHEDHKKPALFESALIGSHALKNDTDSCARARNRSTS
jgi:hypothetical protein